MNPQSARNALTSWMQFLALMIVSFTPTYTSCAVARSGMPASPTTQHKVTLTWFANFPPVAGYNVYRGTTRGGPYTTRLTSSPQTATLFSDSTVQGGTTYYYVVTAVDSQSQESNYSAEIEVAVPSP